MFLIVCSACGARREVPAGYLGCEIRCFSNGEPRPMWDLINAILAAADRPPVTRTIPVGLVRTVGACMEGVYRALRLSGEPPMTRFLASELSTAHWFDLTAARRDLGYEPRVSIDAGLRLLREWLRGDGLKRYGAAR